MTRNGRHFAIIAVLVLIVSAATYFILKAVFRLPVRASAEAGPIDTMFNAHYMFIAFLFSLISVFMLYSVVVFRRKSGDESDGAHFHGNAGLEVVWTIVPLITVITFGVWGAFVLNDITSAEPNELIVNVTGRQWSWVFSYPEYEEVGTSDTLVLPVDRPVRLELTSDDVLHSFWVPEFRVKQDLVPGQTETLRVTPSRVGEYKVRCAEICGFGHANMRADVQVVSEAEFADWVSQKSVSLANLTPVERGQKWASDFGCVGCHSVDGSAMVGPTWLGLFSSQQELSDGATTTADEAYIRESILNPAAKIVAGYANVMPANFESRFADTEAQLLQEQGIEVDIVADLIAYIESLQQ